MNHLKKKNNKDNDSIQFDSDKNILESIEIKKK